jgi:glycosyltransferase involved in cell wall biosynthesis
VDRAPASVLFVHSSSGRYGADRQLQLLAAGLDRTRYRPVVLLPEDGPLVADLTAAGVEVSVRPLAVIRRELAHPRGLAALAAAAARDGARLSRFARSRGVALIHSNTSVVLGGAGAAWLSRVPHIWHVREIYGRYARAWPLYRRVLSTAAALPCVSQATADQFALSAPTRVIADGLWGDPTRAPREEARHRLGLDPHVAAIAVLGRISDWKGQDVLVRALAEAPLSSRGALALVAGDPWPGAEHHVDQLRGLATSLGVSDRVRLLGFRDDVETVLGAADLIAVPSTAPDPLPGAAIEAAAAGCAVIASAHGGLPEIFRDGETGRLTGPGDPHALAAAAAELLDDPARRERLGAAAAADVRTRFAPARLRDAIHALYDSLLG